MIWMPDPGNGMTTASQEELEAEPDDVKALRVLEILRSYALQNEYRLAMITIAKQDIIIMKPDTFELMIALGRQFLIGDENES